MPLEEEIKSSIAKKVVVDKNIINLKNPILPDVSKEIRPKSKMAATLLLLKKSANLDKKETENKSGGKGMNLITMLGK